MKPMCAAVQRGGCGVTCVAAVQCSVYYISAVSVYYLAHALAAVFYCGSLRTHTGALSCTHGTPSLPTHMHTRQTHSSSSYTNHTRFLRLLPLQIIVNPHEVVGRSRAGSRTSSTSKALLLVAVLACAAVACLAISSVDQVRGSEREGMREDSVNFCAQHARIRSQTAKHARAPYIHTHKQAAAPASSSMAEAKVEILKIPPYIDCIDKYMGSIKFTHVTLHDFS